MTEMTKALFDEIKAKLMPHVVPFPTTPEEMRAYLDRVNATYDKAGKCVEYARKRVKMLEMIRKMRSDYNKEHPGEQWADTIHLSVGAYNDLCLEIGQFDLVKVEGMAISIYHVPTRFVGVGGPS